MLPLTLLEQTFPLWSSWCTIWRNKRVQRYCQHVEYVTTFWVFGKNAGNSQYSARPCQHCGDWKRGNGKRETVEMWRWKTRNRHILPNSTFNKNIWILPVPLSLKLSIRHFATNVVMTFSQCSRDKPPQSVSNAAYNFPGSYSATGITNWTTQGLAGLLFRVR